MSAEKSPRAIATIERAADVLTLFTRPDRVDLGVTEVANELNRRFGDERGVEVAGRGTGALRG